MAARAVVGRDAEVATVAAFLRDVTDGPAALVVEGEPGIGKTTLWELAVREAAHAGIRVLASRPSSSETRLTFVGLADFLRDVDESVFDELPLPQRRALDVALLREEPEGRSPEQRVVATACLSLLRTLARMSPLLVAVDDLQWLDTPSRHVLEFALRRRAQEPIGLLAAIRLDGPDARTPAGVDARRLRLRPLNLAALHEILKAELGRTFPRPALVRIEAASSGNPFFALELARALVERGEQLHGSAPLPVPADLAELVTRRLRRLPAASRRALQYPQGAWKKVVDWAVANRDRYVALAPAEIKTAVKHQVAWFAKVKANHYQFTASSLPMTLADVNKIVSFEKTKCGIKFSA